MPNGPIQLTEETRGEGKELIKGVLEFFKTILKVVLIVLVLRLIIIQPFYVRGSSMEPTYHHNEYLVIEKLSYLAARPKRGQVVVFHDPNQSASCARVTGAFDRLTREAINFFGPESCINFIKRVIGLPGETVAIKDGKVFIINKENPEGFQLDERYVDVQIEQFEDEDRFEIADGEYFVLGDNRHPGGSSDSREWGTLPRELILGKVIFRVFPLDNFGFVPTPKYAS